MRFGDDGVLEGEELGADDADCGIVGCAWWNEREDGSCDAGCGAAYLGGVDRVASTRLSMGRWCMMRSEGLTKDSSRFLSLCSPQGRRLAVRQS